MAQASEETSSDEFDQGFDDVKLSFDGVTMLLNNEWSEAEELFNKYKWVKRYQAKVRFDCSLSNIIY